MVQFLSVTSSYQGGKHSWRTCRIKFSADITATLKLQAAHFISLQPRNLLFILCHHLLFFSTVIIFETFTACPAGVAAAVLR